MIKNRAIELAKERISAVSHSMALEDQQVSGQDRDKQVEFLALEILAGPRRDLW